MKEIVVSKAELKHNFFYVVLTTYNYLHKGKDMLTVSISCQSQLKHKNRLKPQGQQHETGQDKALNHSRTENSVIITVIHLNGKHYKCQSVSGALFQFGGTLYDLTTLAMAVYSQSTYAWQQWVQKEKVVCCQVVTKSKNTYFSRKHNSVVIGNWR